MVQEGICLTLKMENKEVVTVNKRSTYHHKRISEKSKRRKDNCQ